MICVSVIGVCCKATAQTDDPLRHGHALLIGISEYDDVSWPPLDDVPLQLESLRRALKPHFDTVEVAENLTTDRLWQKIDQFLRDYGNNSTARLLIYYAGHGYTELIPLYNESRGYITGTDTPSIASRTRRAFDAARLRSISMARIRAPLQEILARHVIFIFDSCFSGTIFTNRSINDHPISVPPEAVNTLLETPARNFITAGRANQTIPAHSPLPDLLIAALNGAADRYQHGVISAEEIGIYLKDQMLRNPTTNITPQEGRLQDTAFSQGEFLFRVAPRQNAELETPVPRSTAGKMAPTSSEMSYEIGAYAIPTGRSTPTHGKEFRFAAFLNGSEELKETVDHVQYGFHHRTFCDQDMISRNRGDNFKVQYDGWGCLRNVEVTIAFKDGRAQSQIFDMCRAIQQQN